MSYLLDDQSDLPRFNVIEISGPAAAEAFRTLLMRYLASEVPGLEKK